MRTFRQGDLLFIEVKQLPLDIKPASSVLATGEATGHKHKAKGELLVFKTRDKTFLQGSGTILHEEHSPLFLPEGSYEMRRQREYQAGTKKVRMVED